MLCKKLRTQKSSTVLFTNSIPPFLVFETKANSTRDVNLKLLLKFKSFGKVADCATTWLVDKRFKMRNESNTPVFSQFYGR